MIHQKLNKELIIDLYGYGFQQLDFFKKNQWRDIGLFLAKNFLCFSNEELCQRHIVAKQRYFKNVLQVDNCPFLELTGVSWEEMFSKAHENNDGVSSKILLPWHHIVISSEAVKNLRGPKCALIFDKEKEISYTFDTTGKECVEIENKLYTYGEAKIHVYRSKQGERDRTLRILFPAIFIDEQLISIRKRENYHEVMERLQSVFLFSSHDAYLHSVFMESHTPFRKRIEQSRFKNFLKTIYYMYDAYEVFYGKLTVDTMQLCVNQNPVLLNYFYALLREVYTMTERWPGVERKYILFVLQDRLQKVLPYYFPHITYDTYVEYLGSGNGTKYPRTRRRLKMLRRVKVDTSILIDLFCFNKDTPRCAICVDDYGEPVYVSYGEITKHMLSIYNL